MEMKLIEVALALVTIYLVMALATTQIVEMVSARRQSRPKVLESVINEVFGDNSVLASDFFSYAPIYALSEGDRKPSAIPPDLFAEAFLAVLNNKKPPRSDFRTPAQFVAALNPESEHLKQVLEAHVAGAEADWDAFTSKIAHWYKDICDRAIGWFKRDTALKVVWVAAIMTVLLNVDSTFIARTLLENENLRLSFANIGQLIAEQFGADANRNARIAPVQSENFTKAAEVAGPFAISAELDRALGEIRAAVKVSPDLIGFGNDHGKTANACLSQLPLAAEELQKDTPAPEAAKGATPATVAKKTAAPATDAQKTLTPVPLTQKRTKAGTEAQSTLYDSNYDAWTWLMTDILGKVEEASLGISSETAKDYLQNGNDRLRNLRHAMMCTTAVAKWVRAAQYAPRIKEAVAAAHLKEAAAALDRARERMLALVTRMSVPLNLMKSYAVLGQGFFDCVDEAANSRAAFDQCLATANSNLIPFGWPTRAGQFCRISRPPQSALRDTATAPAIELSDFRRGWNQFWGCRDFVPNGALDLPEIKANFDVIPFVGTLIGWTLTAVLVSLGAPFWYGLLGKVTRLRMAGPVRGLGEDQASPAAIARSEPAARTDLPPEQAKPPTPFDSARNEFERAMQPQEISRLQIALGLPPTMHLDEVTRNAFAARLQELGQPPDRELGPTTYYMVVGRRTAQVAVDAPSVAVWSIGTRDPIMAPQLIAKLNVLFPEGQLQKLKDSETFDHNLRARCALFRFKTDQKSSPIQKDVVALANSSADELMRLDESTRRAILAAAPSAAFARDPSPWLDFGYGELGVREDEVAPEGETRVDAYLKSMSSDSTLSPAKTKWCGAFVGWVLKQDKRLDPQTLRPDLLEAMNWNGYGTKRAVGQHGDICIVTMENGQHHVALLIEIDAQGRHWLLGGNQGKTGGGGVTLVPFKSTNTFLYRAVS